jgi:cyclic-di-GMP-binding protein
MTTLQPINQLLEQLHVPIQDLAQLSFCDGSREASIKNWVRSLPLTQSQFVSGLLYQALPDISRFQTGVRNRLNILETLRLPTEQAIEGLAQSFLNQPLILPDNAVKTATVAQALQKHMINGYLVCLRDFCKESTPRLEFLALSIHRAITGMGLLLLRYYQLYTPVSGQLWTELHSLYQIALHFDVSELEIEEPLFNHHHCATITLAYTRVLLLACSRPNQLGQDEVLATYKALNILTGLAQLQDLDSNADRNANDNPDHTNLYAVALNSNHPPQYLSRLRSLGYRLLLELNTNQLSKRLQEIDQAAGIESAEKNNLRNELQLTSALTQHLSQAWNVLAQRNFDRQEAGGFLDVTVGISSIHYHLALGTNFTHFLNKLSGTRLTNGLDVIFQNRTIQLKDTSQQKSEDPWGDTFDISDKPLTSKTVSTKSIERSIRASEEGEFKEAHPIYKVPMIDSSPSGYCIEWRNEIPSQVKAGELLGLRDLVRNRWSLGVVRWANQTQGITQLGIQILAPQATPVGLAIIHKSGDASEYLRALEIPALKAINQPATLITNAISFREYSKARLYRRATQEGGDSINQHIQLTRRCFATGSFNQFSYREIVTGKPKEPEKPDDFDSVWDS